MSPISTATATRRCPGAGRAICLPSAYQGRRSRCFSARRGRTAARTPRIGALWHDGDLYFTSNPETRKSRDLAANPACTIAMRLPGIDLVFDREAARTTDPATLAAVAALFREDGWPAEVTGDAITAPFSAPSAGPPPWHLYRCAFHTVVGVATAEPYGATRWRFGGEP
jgi:hypothetical protein